MKVYCIYCGWKANFTDDSDVDIGARSHVSACKKHPMRSLETRITALERLVARKDACLEWFSDRSSYTHQAGPNGDKWMVTIWGDDGEEIYPNEFAQAALDLKCEEVPG